jgi:hypothetical protein
MNDEDESLRARFEFIRAFEFSSVFIRVHLWFN